MENEVMILAKEAVSPSQFIKTYQESSKEALMYLLSLQSNKYPLKKGGNGIAFKSEALIRHCRMDWSSEENVVFDIILATISSYPENETYKIYVSDIANYVAYKNDKTIYAISRKGCEKLKKTTLRFEGLGKNGCDEISIPWYSILLYHNSKGGRGSEPAYIEFVPTDFFKSLVICAGLAPGAYYKIKVLTSLGGSKYTQALFYLLSYRKNYKAYKEAKAGYFEMSLEELRYQLKIPKSYLPADIKRRILEPAMKAINGCEDCDFTFKYTEGKDKMNSKYFFEVSCKKGVIKPVNKEDGLYNDIRDVVCKYEIHLTNAEIHEIVKCAKSNKKSDEDVFKAIDKFAERSKVDKIVKPESYIKKMLTAGVIENKPAAKKVSTIYDFQQNTYDFKELERHLLAAK